jgi:hypothetical protein
MTLRSKPFYWVTCDFPVDSGSPTDSGTHDLSAQEDSDYSAWADESSAIDQAVGDGEWFVSPDGDKHYCWDHPRITQDDLDDGEPAPKPPYLLLDDNNEAILVESES